MSKFFVRAFLFCAALVAVGFWSSWASAALNIYEPFNYSNGQLQGNTNTSAGTSAINNIWLQAGTGNPPAGINVTSNNLTGPLALPPSAGSGLSITHSLTNDGATNRLALDQNYNGTPVYFSFLLNVADLSNLNNTTGAFFFSFNNTGDSSQTGNPTTVPGKAQIRIDPTDGTKFNLGFFGGAAATSGSSAWATNKLDINNTYFIAGSINTGASATRLARLWIDPLASDYGKGTAPTATASDTNTTTWSGNNIQSALVRQNLILPNLLIMDELRVGDSWAAVTPTLSAYWDIDGTTTGAGGGGAPSDTWDGSNWSPSSNGDAATQAWFGSSYKAVFSAGDATSGGQATGAYTVTVTNPQTASGLTFEDGSPTITGAAVTLTGGSIVTNSGVTATISSAIAGSAGLNTSGAGTVVLTGNDTYSGTTTISAGTLQVGGGSSGSLPVASQITNNGALVFNRDVTVTQGGSTSGTDFDSTSAGISGTGSLTQAGSGNLVLPVANTYSGNTNATAGTLTIKHTLAVQNSVVITDGGGSVVFDPTLAGQNVTVGGLSSTGTGYTAPPSNNMSLTINAVSGNASYAAGIGGTGTMTKKGTFAQTLSGTNTFSGATSINVGTLQYAQKTSMPAGSAITVNGKSDWTVTSGTSTNITGGILSVYADDVTGNPAVWSNSSASSAGTIGGLINGIGGQGNSIIWKNGSSLGVHVESGLGDATAGIVYSGVIGNFNTVVTLAGDFNNDNTVNAADYTTYRKIDNTTSGYTDFRSTFGQTGGGPGTTNNIGFMKRGYGTLTLSGANTYSGQLKVNDEGGTLRLTSVQTNAGQSMALPAVYIGGATATTNTTLKVLTNDAIPTNSLIRFGTGANTFISVLRLHDADPPIIGTIPTQSYNQTVRGLSGGNGQIQVGGGTLTINTPANETYSTSTRFRTDYDSLGAVDTVNPVNNRQHGTIIKTGAGRQDLDFFDSLNSSIGFIKGEFILQQGTVGIGNSQIFGLGNIGDPTAPGQFLPWPRLTINGGTLINTSGSSLNPNVQTIMIGGSFTFDVNGGSDTQWNGNGGKVTTTLTTNNPTITVLGSTLVDGSFPTGALIFAGDIVDDGTPRGFTKSGPGTLILGSPGNSYRGETTIQQGALRVRYQTNGNNPGTARIGDGNGRVNLSGGTLEYNGSVASGVKTFSVINPVRVTANSEIDYSSTTTGLTATTDPSGVIFDFASNVNGDAFDWTFGTLKFRHNGASQAITYRPSFSRTGFNYAGPVVIDNGAGTTRKTVLQGTNTSGTQTWSGDISGSGSFRRAAANGETVFNGANSFSGGTIVDDGILTVSGSNATFGGGNLTVNAGHAAIAAGVLNAIANTATLTLLGGGAAGADTGYIDLANLVNEQVATLILGSTSFTTGMFGSTASGAPNPGFVGNPDEYFSGTGVITVAPAPANSLDSGAVPEPAALSIMMFAFGSALVTSRRVLRRRMS